MVRYRILMDSMTSQELDDPAIITSSRMQRIARVPAVLPKKSGNS